jgi:hypothetical protein
MVPAVLATRARMAVVGAVAVALLAAPAVARHSAARGDVGPQLLLYGDSLVYEAEPYADDLLRNVARVEGVAIGVGGSATCDWLPGMRVDARRYRPRAVVLAFSGNAFTPCMQDGEGRPLQGDAWLARYRSATREAIALFTGIGAHVWIGTAPISLVAEKKQEDDVWRLARMAHELAAQHPMVHVADAAAGLLDHGFWTRTKPCLPNEPCTGGVDEHARPVNTIRSHDTAHFCPVPYSGVTERCPAHSSGALRYALGLLAPPFRALGWWDPAVVRSSMAAGWP